MLPDFSRAVPQELHVLCCVCACLEGVGLSLIVYTTCRSNAKLERLLDWLLAVYKIAFPVLVRQAIMYAMRYIHLSHGFAAGACDSV